MSICWKNVNKMYVCCRPTNSSLQFSSCPFRRSHKFCLTVCNDLSTLSKQKSKLVSSSQKMLVYYHHLWYSWRFCKSYFVLFSSLSQKKKFTFVGKLCCINKKINKIYFVIVCANNIWGEYSLLDSSPFELLSHSLKNTRVNKPHPAGIGQRPSDA